MGDRSGKRLEAGDGGPGILQRLGLFPLKFLSVLKCVGRLRRGEEVVVTEVCPQRSDPSGSGV